ncbi:hypothetical protein SORBI_3005G149100 [Sorghum bicolor]|uniref:Uncharacterized protein n=1 Tax=Sorghum bicolor TaxID=4558 RepID=A0A1Z5RIM5_SORBI|nr:hypothetical protein SORBI_3005G149100 [Sorghum bicolor]
MYRDGARGRGGHGGGPRPRHLSPPPRPRRGPLLPPRLRPRPRPRARRERDAASPPAQARRPWGAAPPARHRAVDEEPRNLPPRARVLAGALRAHTRRHGPGYMPAGPWRGAPGEVPALTPGNLDNAKVPVLAGNKFVAYIPGRIIRGLRDRVLGGRGVLYIGAEDLAAHGAARVVHLNAPPRVVAEINGARITSVFRIVGGAAAGPGADQGEEVLPGENEPRPNCDGAVARPNRDLEENFGELEGQEVPLHLDGEDGPPEAADGVPDDGAVARPNRDAEDHFGELEGHEVPLHLDGEDGRPEAADGVPGDGAVARPNRDAEDHFGQLEGHEVPLHLDGEDGRAEAGDGAVARAEQVLGMGGDVPVEEEDHPVDDGDVAAAAVVQGVRVEYLLHRLEEAYIIMRKKTENIQRLLDEKQEIAHNAAATRDWKASRVHQHARDTSIARERKEYEKKAAEAEALRLDLIRLGVAEPPLAPEGATLHPDHLRPRRWR